MPFFRNMCGQAMPGMQMPYPTCGMGTPYPAGGTAMPFPPGGMTTPYPSVPAMPALPSGMPTGPAISGGTAMTVMPPPFSGDQPPQTVESVMYTPGYLKTQIGRRVKVDFLIGTNSFMDKTGTLLAVGVSYIILREQETDDLLLCDIYSIKFVTFYY